MEKTLLDLAVGLVQAQASSTQMSGDEIGRALIKVYNAIYLIFQAEKKGALVDLNRVVAKTRSLDKLSDDPKPFSSIQDDKVICLECGLGFRQLTANHLRSHGLTPREYKKKWGFPVKQPLAARNLTKLRSSSAKKRGLPENLKSYLEDQRKKKGAGPVK